MPDQASLDSSSQTGNASGGDWQEEIYQKIKSMNEMYYPDFNKMYQRLVGKLQKHEAVPQNEGLDKLRFLKVMLERYMAFLHTDKNQVQIHYKDNIVGIENQFINILNSNRVEK